jgi:hypothetical protein
MTTVNQLYRKLNPSGATPREISEVVNNLVDGKSNNTGSVTLATGNATTTIINNERIGYDSVILLAPVTEAAGNNLVPFASYQNTVDQTFAAANTAYTVALNTTDIADGSYLSANKIYVRNAGTYNVQYSLQLANTTTQIDATSVWLKLNGVNIDGTASKFDVPAKHGSSDGYLIAVANFFVTCEADDYIELGIAIAATGTYIEAYAAQTTPYARPLIPSSVVTLTLASPIQSPYVSAQSKGTATLTHYANSVADKTYKYLVVG